MINSHLALKTIHHPDPALHFIEQLLQQASNENVSDIHFEPQAEQCRIRFRRQGLLYLANTISPHFAAQITASLKIMAQLDITEKRMPQDGRIHFANFTEMNIRISTCPSLFGEKVALRIMNQHQAHLVLSNLGLSEEQQITLEEKLTQPQGLIIITGPTGSGKTSTLYAALNYLNQVEKNIITIEDPIEIKLDGITQINVNPRIDLSFSHLLRSIMRQDPDVIMIGEIRDRETAEIAIQAAQTGHLVLSTLHCDDATDSLARLNMLGITTPYLQTALSLIVAQRLIRILCSHGDHCEQCHQGFSGRTGIFELSTIQKNQIHTPQTLWQTGMQKINQHLTTMAELKRVLNSV